MVASLTPLPVIGVPVRASTLDGLDSLLSIVQVLKIFCFHWFDPNKFMNININFSAFFKIT